MKNPLTAWTLIVAFMVTLSEAPCASAQSPEPAPPAQKESVTPHYYHLSFVVKELEGGKAINSRTYFMSIGTNEKFLDTFNTRSIRTGTKVPILTGPSTFTYVDVGVNIDCKSVIALGDRVAMDLSAEVSSVQKDTDDPTRTRPSGESPVIQSNKWNSQAVMVLGKPTIVFSSDEVTSKRSMELEVTATEIK